MSKKRWEPGDFGFFEYELAEVKETEYEKGRGVVGISTGYFSVGGNGLEDRLRPMSMAAKLVALEVKRVEDGIRKMERGASLNWPDLHRKFVELWLQAHDRYAKAPDKSPYDDLYAFESEVKESMARAYDVEIGGISLFGRR